jgi:hypothetical protein
MTNRDVGRDSIEFRGARTSRVRAKSPAVCSSLKSTICAIGDAMIRRNAFGEAIENGTSDSRRAFQEQCPPDRNVAMYIRILIAAMVYLMVQAIMFGAGIILVLATPLNAMAMQLIPWVVGVTAVLSLPISWLIAPRLRARYWREKGVRSDFISGPI